jgi:fumarate hydratase, class I
MSKPVCVISEHDFVASIADALHYVAVYHPPSFVRALAEGMRPKIARPRATPSRRSSSTRKWLPMAAARSARTGVVNVFAKIGMGARIDSTRRPAELSTTRWPSRSTSYGPNSSRCWRR